MEGTILDHSRRGGVDHGKRTRSDGVRRRRGKCRGGEQSHLRCVFGYLLVAGMQKDGPHRARHGPAGGPWAILGRLPLRVFSIGKYASHKKIVPAKVSRK